MANRRRGPSSTSGNPAPSQDGERVASERMQRGVTQLLFNYLPNRTVDWEDGLAIVQLRELYLSQAWEEERSSILLDEVAQALDQWRARGGRVDSEFPDPRTERGLFCAGPPQAIDAQLVRSAYVCRGCGALHFPDIRALTERSEAALTCRRCGARPLRQFPFVFIHGCGELIPVTEWIPRVRPGTLEPTTAPLRCRTCGNAGVPTVQLRTERVRDMRVTCGACGGEIRRRLDANCPRCLRRLARERAARTEDAQETHETAIARVAMRVARYNASEGYYPQTVSILRLDRPTITAAADPLLDPLATLIATRGGNPGNADNLGTLVRRIQDEEAAGRMDQAAQLRLRLAQVATAPATQRNEAEARVGPALQDDVRKSLRESVALRTTVRMRAAQEVALEGQGASGLLHARVNEAISALGLREVLVVDDLPIITAAYGYTRRSFEPTYTELSAENLPTEIRPFPPLNRYAAVGLQRPDLAGCLPIPAREGDHEGLFLALDPPRVAAWLRANGIQIPDEEQMLPSLLAALEPIDRYYDDIWSRPVRRMLFGLVHTLAHVAMRAATRFAGLERTSINEYLFLPLLGAVIYDSASAFQLGGLRTLARDHLLSFLEALADEGVSCLYDPECGDHRGACHGCVHSPEICCRVFNHGLSRAFLSGGHAPWVDVSTPTRIVGYWEMP